MTDTRHQLHERESQVAPPVRSGEFTPGPWSVNMLTQYHTEVFSGNYLICEAIGGQLHLGEPRNFEQDEANARLIAAAPDMLAVLKDCLPLFDLVACGEVQERVTAAIAKATMTAQAAGQSPLPRETGDA